MTTLVTHSTEKTEAMDPLELIADPKLARLLNVSLRSLARWDADKKNNFPPPVLINSRKFRRRAEIEAWLHERALASLQPAPNPVRRPPAETASEAPGKNHKTRTAHDA